jgi:regulator of protease activity HflC (stomatin/prohibitin superfamily)
MPVSEEQRKLVHREFTANPKNVESAVRAHLVNCIKATATMMTASENQTSRKAEFAKVVGDQLAEGLYRFRRVEKPLLDLDGTPKLDPKGRAMTAFATEIIEGDAGQPVIDAESPLKQYGIDIAQFSVTSVEYDTATREQFAKKKDASLKAELAKIQVEQARQETQQKIEEGLRMKAEKEAEMNVQVAQAKGEAEMKVAQAEQAKLEAQEAKEKAVIQAQQKLEVAELDLQAAEKEGQAKIVLAEARQKEIDLAGFITEKDKVLAEIAKDRDIGVAAALAGDGGLRLPDKVVSMGGGAGSSGANDLFQVIGVNQTLDLIDKLGTMDTRAKAIPAVATK